MGSELDPVTLREVAEVAGIAIAVVALIVLGCLLIWGLLWLFSMLPSPPDPAAASWGTGYIS